MTMLPPDPVFILRNDISIMALLTSDDHQLIYCGVVDGTVQIWDLKTYRQVDRFKNSEESCLSLHFAKDKTLLVQDKMGLIKLWSKSNGLWENVGEFCIDYLGFCQVMVNEDILVAPKTNGKIQLLQLPPGNAVKEFNMCSSENLGEVMALCVTEISKKKCILVGLEVGHICVCDWEKGPIDVASLKVAEDCPMAIDYDKAGGRGIIGTSGSSVTIFTIASNFTISIKRVVNLVNEGVASIKIRPDRKLAVLGCWDGKIRLLSWKTLVTLAVLDTHSSTVQTLVFTSESPYILAAGCKDGNISLWDLYNKKK